MTTAFSPSPSLTSCNANACRWVAAVSRHRNHVASSAGQWMNLSSRKDDSDQDEDYNDDDDAIDLEAKYLQSASSEFKQDGADDEDDGEALTLSSSAPLDQPTTNWQEEYTQLSNRVSESKSGQAATPSKALFRLMTLESPNESIRSFVTSASPTVISAMSGTVQSLLGGLAKPGAGVETIVKANGEKLGSLCFQLQMTGYMFRNAEYVLAIKDLMNLQGGATLEEYKAAFDKLDSDGSGYIEVHEIRQLLADVYHPEEIPAVEITSFLEFFDSNHDGRISWQEFETGLGIVAESKGPSDPNTALPSQDDEDEEEDEDLLLPEPKVSGMIEIEMKNGRVVQVEAREYINELKKEAASLKLALRREQMGPGNVAAAGEGMDMSSPPGAASPSASSDEVGISSYIASLQGDFQSLTSGISPDVVESMKMLVDFVLDGGPSGRGKGRSNDKDLEMEIPSSALQQLALWQLVLGYKLREAEATGEYRKMLE